MDTYEVRLAQFEGPLDLLLHLVSRAQIDLKDIFVSEITQQYIDLMEQLPEVDLDRASEFVRYASVLLFIKSRYLLPAPPPPVPEDEEDPEAELMEQLRLYKMYKDAAEKLREREHWGDSIFSKPPEDLLGEEETLDIRGTPQLLLQAFLRILRSKRRKRVHHAPEVEIQLETWTVPQQKEKVMAILSEKRTASFSDLFDEETASVEEVVVTFSALLELWNAGSLRVTQSAPFGRIRLDYMDSGERARA